MLVGLGSFVPLVGAFVTGVLAVAVAGLSKGLVAAIIVVAVLLLDNQIEAHVLQPFVVGRYVRIHPLAVVLALASGAVLFGIFGAIVAVPVVACINSAVRAVMDSRDQPSEGDLDSIRGWMTETAAGRRSLIAWPGTTSSGRWRRTSGRWRAPSAATSGSRRPGHAGRAPTGPGRPPRTAGRGRRGPPGHAHRAGRPRPADGAFGAHGAAVLATAGGATTLGPRPPPPGRPWLARPGARAAGRAGPRGRPGDGSSRGGPALGVTGRQPGAPPWAGPPRPGPASRDPLPPVRHRWDATTVVGLLAVLFGVAWLHRGDTASCTSRSRPCVAIGLMLLGRLPGRDRANRLEPEPALLAGVAGRGMIVVLVATSSTFGLGGRSTACPFGNKSVAAPTGHCRPAPSTAASATHGRPVAAAARRDASRSVSVAGQHHRSNLPADAAVTVDARVVAGQICVNGQRRRRRGRRRPVPRPSVATARRSADAWHPTSTLDVHQVFGQILIGGPGCADR